MRAYRKILAFGVLPLVAGFGSAVWCLASRSAVQASTAEVLVILQEGTRTAFSSVRGGKGKIRVNDWVKLGSDESSAQSEKFEYEVVFSGDQFVVTCLGGTVEATHIPEQTPDAQPVQVFAYDGQRAIRFWPGEKRAVIGDTQSTKARQAISTYRSRISMHFNSLIPVVAPGDPDPRPGTFKRVFGEPDMVRAESLNGTDCYVVQQTVTAEIPAGSRNTISRYWVCPSKGFTVLRYQDWLIRDGQEAMLLIAETNAEVKEYAPGLWGPAKVDRVRYAYSESGEQHLAQHTTITYDPDFEVNPTVSASDLELQLPSGTVVYDELLNAEYALP